MRYYGIKIQGYDSESLVIKNMNAKDINHLIERLENDPKVKHYEIPEKYQIESSLQTENNSDKDNILDTAPKMAQNSKEEQPMQSDTSNPDDLGKNSDSEHEQPIFEPKKETFSEKVKAYFSKKNDPEESEDYFNSDDDFIDEFEEPKNHDPDVIGALLTPILTTLMSVFNNVFNREIFTKIDFSKSETKQIKQSFIDAFPDTKINPKVSFFSTIIIIIGGKLNFKSFINKDEENEKK